MPNTLRRFVWLCCELSSRNACVARTHRRSCVIDVFNVYSCCDVMHYDRLSSIASFAQASKELTASNGSSLTAVLFSLAVEDLCHFETFLEANSIAYCAFHRSLGHSSLVVPCRLRQITVEVVGLTASGRPTRRSCWIGKSPDRTNCVFWYMVHMF